MRTPNCLRLAAGVVMLVLAAPAAAPAAQNQRPEPSIALATKPAPPAAGKDSALTVTVKDAEGRPVTGADVSIVFVMPMGAMGDMKVAASLEPSPEPKTAAAGAYVGTVQLGMAGTWTATVTVKTGGKPFAEKKLTVIVK